MDKVIITFHDYDGKLVRRTITHVQNHACINPARAIMRNFRSGLFKAQQDDTYSAVFRVESSPFADVYDYVPYSGKDVHWQHQYTYPTNDEDHTHE